MFFFFNDTATTEIYTLSLHDALPICHARPAARQRPRRQRQGHHREGDLAGRRYCSVRQHVLRGPGGDRKSTRLNSSHLVISYAVFCLKKKKPIVHSKTELFVPARNAT